MPQAFEGRLTSNDRRGTTNVLVAVPGQEIAGVDAGNGMVVLAQTMFDGRAIEEAPPLDATLAGVRPNGTTSQIASRQGYGTVCAIVGVFSPRAP